MLSYRLCGIYIETCDKSKRPLTRDQPATDHLLLAVVLFDIAKYTPDTKPPLLKDRFLGIGGI